MLSSSSLPAITTSSQFPSNNQAIRQPTQNTSHAPLNICLKCARPAPASDVNASGPDSPPRPPSTPEPRVKLPPTAMQKERETKRNADFKIFSALLCSANGIDALHDALSGYSSEISLDDIAARLDRTDYACLETEIERIGSKRSLTDMAVFMHMNPGTTQPPDTVAYASLKLSADAIVYLRNCCKNGIPVRAGRFIPCGEESDIRKNDLRKAGAGGNLDGRHAVFLTLIGHSRKPLDVAISMRSSYTSVFSPRATFKVDRVVIHDETEMIEMTLKETAKPKTALDMPH